MILDPLRATTGVQWSAAVTVESPAGVIGDDVDAGGVLPIASVGKLLLLATVLDAVEQGSLDPGELLTATETDRVADSGLLQHLDEQRASVLDLCRFVGAVSDNLATNVLLRRVGLDLVTATTARCGLPGCALHDYVRDERSAPNPPALSTGSAAGLVMLVRRARAGELLSPRVSSQLVELLRLNVDLSMVAAAFGLDPLSHGDEDLGVRLFNKTGANGGTRADVGCVETAAGERSACYAVIARFDGSMATTRRTVLAAMRAVGEAIGAALEATP